MFREGDPEVTLAHWAIILDYADAVYARAVVESFKKIPSMEYEPLLAQPLFPELIYGPSDPTQVVYVFEDDKKR